MTDIITQTTPARNILNMLAMTCHEMSKSKGFWEGVDDLPEEIKTQVMGNKISLMHSELSEALEALRMKDFPQSKKIPEHSLLAEEFADAIIRILDFCGKYGIDIGGATISKILYNSDRPHMHGKKF